MRQPELDAMASAARCTARNRRGLPCGGPAVRGRRTCRMHGGTNPGAPKGNRNAWKHGARSAEFQAVVKAMRPGSI
ncbi:hypothetical protein DBR21_14945 [Caulobacter sp. HMWF009]|nr:hypothetical protein DBR21_14945 [Caulobacter sp. HMWF009]